MATTSNGNEFTVFKFKETGMVALCLEVADLIRLGEAPEFLDLNSATFRETDHSYDIVFQIRKDSE